MLGTEGMDMRSRLPWTALGALALATPAGAGIPFGPRQLIAPAGSFQATFLAAVDVDGDRDFDLVRGGYSHSPDLPGGIVWHENTDAHGAFGPPRIIAASTGSGIGIAVADLDGDGDPDVIDSDFWHENAAGDGSSWVAHAMPLAGRSALAAVDLDRDGDVDLVVDDTWQENDGASPPGWIPHTIGQSGTTSVAAGDLDGDTDLDVVYFTRPVYCGSGCAVPGSLTWFESDGASPPSWTAHDIGPTEVNCIQTRLARLFPADFDGDGDRDVVLACYDAIYAVFAFGETRWFENDGGSPPTFSEHELGIYGGGTLFDLDRDGDLDLLTNGNDATLNDSIAWYENDGAAPPGLTLNVVDGSYLPATAHAPFDVDLDGDLDLVLTDQDELVWYPNLTESIPALPSALRVLLPGLLLAAAWRLRARLGSRPRGLRP